MPDTSDHDRPIELPSPQPAARKRRRLPHRGRPEPLRPANRLLRIAGPGLITGASDDDPSGIGTYSQVGAAFGTGFLWMALYILPLVICVQEMCGRIGLVTGRGIAGCVRRYSNRQALFGAVLLLFIANTINVGADLGAMAASVQLLAPAVPFGAILIVFAVGILLLEIFVPYRYYARILKMLTLSLLAYLVTGILIHPDWLSLLRETLVPSIQLTPEFLALAVAVLGTTASPYLFFWQAAEEVEEEHEREEQKERLAAIGTPAPVKPGGHQGHLRRAMRALRLDTALGMTAASATFWFIVMVTGLTLHAHGIRTIATAAQAAEALRPLAGDLAGLIFALGIVGTGLLAIPVLAGSAAYGIAEAFGWREGLSERVDHARGFYAVIAAATLIGLALNFLGINPIAALVYTAVINGIVAVPLLVLLLMIANNRAIMGDFTNKWLSNVVGILTTVIMFIAAIALVISLLPH
ncbi:MAG TPA: Nramp family divalent metal transporter [Ktedonobacterales bacterium]|jgi:NRAMP (natural resistance-associated macrophage protein)-like metal ion transporter